MTGAVKRILAAAAELSPPENAAEKLELYIDTIITKGKRLNLFSQAELTPNHIADHHILDAVEALRFGRPRRSGRVLDFGAGSGVVGVTWKILRPDLSLVFLESMKRKAFFLDGVINLLNMKEAAVWAGRDEEMARSEPATIDFVVSRGVASNRKTIRSVRMMLRPFGEALFFKGPATAPEIRRLIRMDPELSPLREETLPLGSEKERIFVQVSRVHIER